jgi:hypothetical protein
VAWMHGLQVDAVKRRRESESAEMWVLGLATDGTRCVADCRDLWRGENRLRVDASRLRGGVQGCAGCSAGQSWQLNATRNLRAYCGQGEFGYGHSRIGLG